MITFHPSWDFLKDFYQSDHSIADLVNKAIGYRSGKLLRIDSFENFMEDLLSLIPTKGRDISYQEFLDYVKPYERDPELAGKEYDGEFIDLEEQENAFLGYNWLMDFVYEGISGAITFGAVSGKLALKTALKDGKGISQFSTYKSAVNFKNDISQAILSNARYTPYLMLDALGLAEEWFLYGHNSKGFLPIRMWLFFSGIRESSILRSCKKGFSRAVKNQIQNYRQSSSILS